MARDNKSIGRFRLANIPRALQGIPQLEVTFDIDANSILKVSAIEKSTKGEQCITINVSGGMTEAEISKAAKECNAFAEYYSKSLE